MSKAHINGPLLDSEGGIDKIQSLKTKGHSIYSLLKHTKVSEGIGFPMIFKGFLSRH